MSRDRASSCRDGGEIDQNVGDFEAHNIQGENNEYSVVVACLTSLAGWRGLADLLQGS